MNRIKVLCLSIALAVAARDDGFKLVMLDGATETTAMCLDGSRGGFYLRPGSSELWVLEME